MPLICPRWRPRRAASALAVSAVLTLLAACSGGGGGEPAEQLPAFTVVEVFPPDGATGVLWREPIRVEFSEPVLGIGLEDLTVEDGAGPLGGLLEPSIDGRTWWWRPLRDLPRGAALTVRLAPDLRAVSGARPASSLVASYRVIDHLNQDEHWLGTTQGGEVAALAWPSGHLAAAAGPRVHDLTTMPVITTELPLLGGPMTYVPDEIGGYTVLAREGYMPFVLEAAHGTIGGPALTSTLLSSPAAFGRSEHVANARGDCAVYSYGILGTQAHEGLFFARAGTATWTAIPLSSAGSYPVRHVAIDGSGNLFVGYIDGATGRLRLQRHDLTQNTSRTFEVSGMPDDFALGALGNGEARVLWTTRTNGGQEQVRLARRYRDGGLRGEVELHRGEPRADRAFATASGGAAVAVSEHVASQRWYLQRFEPDGTVTAPQLISDGATVGPFALGIAPRGEAWFVWAASDPSGDVVRAARSRPGAEPEAPRVLYEAQFVEEPVRKLAVAVEDSGRVVVVLSEDHTGPLQRVKAIVLQ